MFSGPPERSESLSHGNHARIVALSPDLQRDFFYKANIQLAYFSIAGTFSLLSSSPQSAHYRIHPSYNDKVIDTVLYILISGNSSPSPLTLVTTVFSALDETGSGDDGVVSFRRSPPSMLGVSLDNRWVEPCA